MSLTIKEKYQSAALVDSRGVVILEATLVISLFAIVFLIGMDLARMLHTSQIMGLLSKQAANLAFRDCRDNSDCLDGPSDPRSLLNTFRSLRDAQLPEADLIVSKYSFNPATGSVNLDRRLGGLLIKNGAVLNPGKRHSRFNHIRVATEIATIQDPNTRTVYIAEVFYQFRNPRRNFSIINFTPSELYEVTIY